MFPDQLVRPSAGTSPWHVTQFLARYSIAPAATSASQDTGIPELLELEELDVLELEELEELELEEELEELVLELLELVSTAPPPQPTNKATAGTQ